MKLLGLIFTLICSFSSHGFTIPDTTYHSGPEVCGLNTDRGREFEKWVEVPVDYSNPDGEKTLIYAYTLKPFNKDLPSVIYFTGGPGLSSRSTEFELPNTNLIFFEQRGISCSRPKTRKLLLNPKFYSSENTARDALNIIKSFGISKVASYGQSYGTVPATIFASFYPEHTSSLILEGVIYEGGKSLWNSERKRNLLQGFFNDLPSETQDRIIDLSTNGQLPANWYSKLGNMLLYMNGGIDTFKEFLSSVLALDDESRKSLVQNFYRSEYTRSLPEDEWGFGDVMMGMIGCQEISMGDVNVSMTSIFEDRKLVYDHDNVDRSEYCMPLHLENIKANYYQASHYPVSVPAFYLLGENDGATDLDQGMNHFYNVAKGPKAVLLMKKGGHMPSLEQMKDRVLCDPSRDPERCKQDDLSFDIFESIIANKRLDENLISTFNKSGPLEWQIIKK